MRLPWFDSLEHKFQSLEHKFQSLEHKFDSLEHNFIAWSETILTHLITNINRKEQKYG